jgi:hypothetical protein
VVVPLPRREEERLHLGREEEEPPPMVDPGELTPIEE